MQKEEKAITLIALIITIIVMLILVGVTINVAINGELFSTAKRAVTKTEEAKDSELRFMAMANAATHNEEWVYEVEGERIPIPAGFAPTEIEGENSLEDGIVIIDAEGNEFVWIPCSLSEYNEATFKTEWSQNLYSGGSSSWTDEQTATGQKSLTDLQARQKNGELTEKGVGFYVARYEAGIPEEATFHPSKTSNAYKTDDKNIGTIAPVSKKGYPAWSYISQTNSKKAAALMYPGYSYLIDSHAWNHICKNIIAAETDKSITNSTDWGNYVNTPTTKYEELDVLYALHHYGPVNGENQWTIATSYSRGVIPTGTAPKNKETNRLELATGASADFKAYNIYDMAGNMWEWTTEEGTNFNGKAGHAVRRGGSFGSNGSNNPVVRADGGYYTDVDRVYGGFRVVLYL